MNTNIIIQHAIYIYTICDIEYLYRDIISEIMFSKILSFFKMVLNKVVD